MVEPALGSASESLDSIFRVSPDALLCLDGDRVVAANDAAGRLFDRDPSDMEGVEVHEILPEGVPVQEKPAAVGVDLPGVRADGTTVMVEATSRRIDGAEGRTLVALRDATHRVEAQEELSKREKRFQEAQQVAHIGSWEWDIPADHVTWTDELYRLYGLEPQSAYIDYERYLELLHPEDRDHANGVVQKAFQEQTPFDFEHRLIQPDGSIRWLRGRGELFTDEAGNPQRMVGTAQDITDQKEAQRIVSEALHEKEVLLKEVHHRVKNNLQVVSSLLRMQGRKTDDPAILRQLSESRGRIRSMALVHEKLYRSDDLALLDSSDYLRDLVAEVRRSAEAPAGIQVDVDVASFPLDLDHAVTLGLLTNELVSNAFKHAFPEGKGTIRVHAARSKGRIALEVQDDGAGLPDGFDPDANDTLGMRLVQSLVHQMDGSLTVQTEGPGATFRVEAAGP